MAAARFGANETECNGFSVGVHFKDSREAAKVQRNLKCGGKRSATPLLNGSACSGFLSPVKTNPTNRESAVAASLCRRSPHGPQGFRLLSQRSLICIFIYIC